MGNVFSWCEFSWLVLSSRAVTNSHQQRSCSSIISQILATGTTVTFPSTLLSTYSCYLTSHKNAAVRDLTIHQTEYLELGLPVRQQQHEFMIFSYIRWSKISRSKETVSSTKHQMQELGWVVTGEAAQEGGTWALLWEEGTAPGAASACGPGHSHTWQGW